MHDNLLKFDILGHDDPTMMKMMEEITGIDPRIIPFHDDEVIKLYTSLESLHLKPEQLLGETVGSFGLPEFGTSFARKLLTVSKPQSFADLVHVAGLSHGTNV
jgi:DNA polymerase-3 subunit alpha (Gram-positive type)